MTESQEDDLAFNYFPEDYRWSQGLLIALNAAPWGGAEIGEIHRIGLELRDRVGDEDAWFRAWADRARKVEDKGRERLAAGHRASAAGYLLRAANYYHTGERFAQPKTEETNAAYKRGVEAFRDATGLMRRPVVESVEIPYEGTTLPALLVHGESLSATGRPQPAMVYLDGFDLTKELQYFKGVPDLVDRGITCLIVDGPGNGEAIRFRGLPLHHETERYATAAYEWLAARSDVDAERIGVMGLSLGGYYAPRAAAFEQRFACCIAWAAEWDYHKIWTDRFAQLDSGSLPSLSVPWQHLLWVFDVETREEAMKQLEGFRLSGVAEQVSCPFLLLHGENDLQIPITDAVPYFEAMGSEVKEFKVFDREEGGYHHCQSDNVSIGVAYMWDWAEDILQPTA